jgi:Ni2+-binding GTPase involved in maturation of urease and hydrogenase
MSTRKPWIVVVGGFLGAGKTSLILAAARLLEKRGLRCAVILNDQGDELVDTRDAEQQGLLAREVTGGCFCCRFSGLMAAIEELRTNAPDVVFAEPVGSCADIAATVLGPLLEEFDSYRLAPFTVVVDPARAAALLQGNADPDLGFLFEKQLQEADLVCLSKADLYPEAVLPVSVEGRRLSAKTGQGVAEWLDEILGGTLEAGGTTLEIDYARYAEAEAALAWLNLSFVYEPAIPLSPALVVGPWMDRLDEALTAEGIPLVHLKIFDRSPAGWLKAALCANGEEPNVEGNLDASAAGRHEVLVNLRAMGTPDVVRTIVEEQLRHLAARTFDVRLNCFSPAPPKPERRVPAQHSHTPVQMSGGNHAL